MVWGGLDVDCGGLVLSIYLLLLALSNFDQYTRECEFGILKKKQNKTKQKKKHKKTNKKNGANMAGQHNKNAFKFLLRLLILSQQQILGAKTGRIISQKKNISFRG